MEAPLGWAALVAAVVDRFGGLDICCALGGATGAGAGDGPLLGLTAGSWRRCLELILTGPLELMTAAARAMVRAGTPGAIVALSSHAAQAPAPSVGALGAARAGLQHIVAVLAQELAPHGIRCNAVSPLAVLPTELFPNPGLVSLAERDTGSLDAWLARRVPLARGQSADETAAVIEFLCSDEASYLTGVTVPVAGGAR
jgi:NAD(P)-dependent dehydrogenase (short-subunit alcohol dehydrogenase family)